MATYYVHRNGKDFGPLSVEELVAIAVKRGGLPGGELVRESNDFSWRRADSFEWLPIKPPPIPRAELVPRDYSKQGKLILIFGGLAFAVGLIGCLAFIAVRSLDDVAGRQPVVAKRESPPVKQSPSPPALPITAPKPTATACTLNGLQACLDRITDKCETTDLPPDARLFAVGEMTIVRGHQSRGFVDEVIIYIINGEAESAYVAVAIQQQLTPSWPTNDFGSWMKIGMRGTDSKTQLSSVAYDGFRAKVHKEMVGGQTVFVLVFAIASSGEQTR